MGYIPVRRCFSLSPSEGERAGVGPGWGRGEGLSLSHRMGEGRGEGWRCVVHPTVRPLRFIRGIVVSGTTNTASPFGDQP
jgi:hypothetical protein